MLNTQNIESIQDEEKNANTAIQAAKDKARKQSEELDHTFQTRFSTLSDELSDEKKAALEKVQTQANSFKDEMKSSLSKELSSISNGADARVKKATEFVLSKFNGYVSQ